MSETVARHASFDTLADSVAVVVSYASVHVTTKHGATVGVTRTGTEQAHRRLPPNPERDSYKRLAQRIWDKDWHINGGPPKESPELNEDAHFMMRCLYWRLPLDMHSLSRI
jgi:hypothetical protein